MPVGPDQLGTLQLFAFWLVFCFLSSVAPITTGGLTFSVNLAPLFAAALTLPPGLAALTGTLGTIDQRVPGKQIPWYQFLFNRAMFGAVYGAASLVFRGLATLPGPHPEAGGIDLQVVSAAIVGLVLIVALNSPIIVVAISLIARSPIRKVAYQSLQGALLSYVGLAPLGALLAYLVATRRLAGYFLAGSIFLLLIIYRELSRQSLKLQTVARGSYVAQSRLIDKKDRSTFGHSERVGLLAEAVATKLRLSPDLVEQIKIGATLHDIGKIAVPDSILHKPGRLNREEWEIMKTHPQEGYEVLAEQEVLLAAAYIVRAHHENYDGSGYPLAVSGADIPIGGRITRVVDSYDCITNVRDYRAWVRRPFEAVAEINDMASTTYDPHVVKAFTEVLIEADPELARALGEEPPAARLGLLQAMRYGPFVRVFAAQALSNFGDMMTTTGLALLAFSLSGSALAVAAVFAARALPNLLFGLVAGSLVDRFDRKGLMILTDLLRALLIISLPFLIHTSFPIILGITFLMSTATVLFNPARTAALPDLVPYNLLQAANSALALAERLTEIAGFAVAGAIVLISSVSLLFAIDALTFLSSAGLILTVRFPEMARGTRPVAGWRYVRDQVAEGLRHIRSSRELRVVFPFSFLMVVAGSALLPLIVPLALVHLHSGAVGFPLLETSIAVGAALGAVLTSFLDSQRRGQLMVTGALGMGLFTAFAGISNTLPLTMIFLAAAGVANTMYLIPMTTAIQELTASNIRGRVFAARFAMIQLGVLLGVAVAGLATSNPSSNRVAAAVIVSGVFMIVVGSGAALSPTLRRI